MSRVSLGPPVSLVLGLMLGLMLSLMLGLVVSVGLGPTSTAGAHAATPAHPVESRPMQVKLRAPHGAYLVLDVDPDWARGNYRVVLQQHHVDRWETVLRGRTSGPRDIWRPSVGAGDFRAVVSRPGFATTTSTVARILE